MKQMLEALEQEEGVGEGVAGALIRIISRCAACANVENVLPSVKGWWRQQVLLPAGHTHTHTEREKCRAQTTRSVCQICMCVKEWVCECGMVGCAEHDDEQMSEEEVSEPDSGDEDKVT